MQRESGKGFMVWFSVLMKGAIKRKFINTQVKLQSVDESRVHIVEGSYLIVSSKLWHPAHSAHTHTHHQSGLLSETRVQCCWVTRTCKSLRRTVASHAARALGPIVSLSNSTYISWWLYCFCTSFVYLILMSVCTLTFLPSFLPSNLCHDDKPKYV